MHALAGHTLHRLSNQAITVDGDNAAARTYIDGLIMAGDNNSGVNAIGFYDDEIVHTPAGGASPAGATPRSASPPSGADR